MTKLSGGLNNYYVVQVKNPQRKEQEPYQAECEDIIQALGMTFDEGCAFKALWRNAAARMGNGKPGNTAVYDCEKLVHYATRILMKEQVTEVSNRFLNEQSVRMGETDTGLREPVKDTEGDDGWIYSSVPPIITQKFESIDVVYRKGWRCEFADITDITWENVWKYRINYS